MFVPSMQQKECLQGESDEKLNTSIFGAEVIHETGVSIVTRIKTIKCLRCHSSAKQNCDLRVFGSQ